MRRTNHYNRFCYALVIQNRSKAYIDQSRWSEIFHEGDELVLSTRNLSVNQHLPAKLRWHWIGPYSITKVISLVAYRLGLPLAWRVHLVFHVSNLKRWTRSKEFERVERPPSRVMVKGHEEHEVEAILRHKGKGSRHLYQVLWKGFPITEASWEPQSHLSNAPQVMEEYLHRVATEDKPWRRQIRGGYATK